MKRTSAFALAVACSAAPARAPAPAPAPSGLDPIDERPWIGWRLDDPANPRARVCPHDASSRTPGVGRAECWRGALGGPKLGDDDGYVGDAEPHDVAPGGACSLEYRQDSEGTIAELAIGNVVIDRASRESEDQGAAIRGAFSPDGRWLAIAKLGARGREIYVVDVKIVPVPASPCAWQ